MKYVMRGVVALGWVALLVIIANGSDGAREGALTVAIVLEMPRVARALGWW